MQDLSNKIKFIGFSNKKLNKFLDKSNYIFWDWYKDKKDLEYIKIYSKDAIYFGKEFGRIQVFIKLKDLYKGIITLRKKAVAIGVFAIDDDIYQLNVLQFRYPTLDQVEEIVAGLIDFIEDDLEKSIEYTIKKEIVEELGLEEHMDIYKSLQNSKPIFIKRLYPSIGDSSEEIFLYAIFLKTSKKDLKNLCHKKAGNKRENESTKVICIKGINNILHRDYKDIKAFIIQLWLKNIYMQRNFDDFISEQLIYQER